MKLEKDFKGGLITVYEFGRFWIVDASRIRKGGKGLVAFHSCRKKQPSLGLISFEFFLHPPELTRDCRRLGSLFYIVPHSPSSPTSFPVRTSHARE